MSWVTVAQTEARKSLDKCLAYCTWSRNSQHRAFVRGVSSAGCRILHLKNSWISFNSWILYYLLLEIHFVTHFTVPLGKDMNGSGKDKNIYRSQLSKTSKYFKHFPTSLWVIPQPTQCIALPFRYRTIRHKTASCPNHLSIFLKITSGPLRSECKVSLDSRQDGSMDKGTCCSDNLILMSRTHRKVDRELIPQSLLLTPVHSLQHVSPPVYTNKWMNKCLRNPSTFTISSATMVYHHRHIRLPNSYPWSTSLPHGISPVFEIMNQNNNNNNKMISIGLETWLRG